MASSFLTSALPPNLKVGQASCLPNERVSASIAATAPPQAGKMPALPSPQPWFRSSKLEHFQAILFPLRLEGDAVDARCDSDAHHRVPAVQRAVPIFYVLLQVFAALIVSVSVISAQETRSATNAPVRRGERPPPIFSPELLPNGDVKFRLRATNATSVKVTGQFGPETALTKNTQGIWSVTVPNIPAGVHEYRFMVDGLNILDPQNSWIKPQRWPGSSILHVPANPPAPWDLQDIPHGTLHLHDYKSKALGRWRHLVVYTPPGASGRMPVLYLSHGYSDNEGTWSAHGKAHWIMDSLITQKKSVPMIIVMMDAHPLPPGAGGFESYGPANSAALCNELVQDIIPLVESNYKAAARPRSRAFAGLSMGGHHALTVAMNHHDKFNWIGAFSSAPPPTNSITAGLNAPESLNQDLKLFWIACGEKDFLFQRNKEFNALLKSKGIRHEYVETEGDHSWPVWRRYLAEFAPKLFR